MAKKIKRQKKKKQMNKNEQKVNTNILRRRTLNVKYSEQYPFRKIVRKPSGKSLVEAQRKWRDGTALIDRLGLPVKFALEEIPKLVEGASIKEKEEIFALCGQALLQEPKAADPDVTDIVLLNALYENNPKILTYYADIVHVFCNQYFLLNNMFTDRNETIRTIQGSFKKAISKSVDPRILSLQASFLILQENMLGSNQSDPFESSISCLKLAIETFEHQMKNFKPEYLEGTARFNVYYVLATVLNKKLNILLTSKKHLRKIKPEDINSLTEDVKLCLELYLKQAPDCHWNVPSASFLLSSEWLRRKTPPTGAKLQEILKRNVSDVENSIKRFDRGIKSCGFLVKWNPHEKIENKAEYKDALQLQQTLVEKNYRKTDIPKVPQSKVEMRQVVDEDNLTWSEWFKWNLTDPRNIQLVYLFIFFGLIFDPIFNIFGFFVDN